MLFEMSHLYFDKELSKPVRFSEHDAPDWLTSVKTAPGSTMDNRWFWNKHVMTLQVGSTVETDFRSITRVE